MRVTKRTNIAVRVLMYCAVHRDRLVTKSEIAGACNASEHHLGQIVNQLAQLGYIETRRGRHGGLKLGREPGEIRLGALFRAFEAKSALAECFLAKGNTCPLVGACRLQGVLHSAGEAFFDALEEFSLSYLVDDNAALDKLFALVEQPLASAKVLD
ncbi:MULTISPECIES: Rrf2 family transcriptional regulator [unclassified Roseivivax]|uniref:Rrf2 family transcriptional regulator n=1 Tax=Roseivivax sp. GX 12232 TaxID=2900547 RepID=UPI001E525384|nr:Rrf2 family transcriptional regulator [Roseivivax sp. GX 12232]MCE0504321.1 Rrf2 family transcriptional regulator [Roseivivax sp. GX 12232]